MCKGMSDLHEVTDREREGNDLEDTAHQADKVAEWLRRWTANPLCSARVGSNPILVETLTFFLFFIPCKCRCIINAIDISRTAINLCHQGLDFAPSCHFIYGVTCTVFMFYVLLFQLM